MSTIGDMAGAEEDETEVWKRNLFLDLGTYLCVLHPFRLMS